MTLFKNLPIFGLVIFLALTAYAINGMPIKDPLIGYSFLGNTDQCSLPKSSTSNQQKKTPAADQQKKIDAVPKVLLETQLFLNSIAIGLFVIWGFLFKNNFENKKYTIGKHYFFFMFFLFAQFFSFFIGYKFREGLAIQLCNGILDLEFLNKALRYQGTFLTVSFFLLLIALHEKLFGNSSDIQPPRHYLTIDLLNKM